MSMSFSFRYFGRSLSRALILLSMLGGFGFAGQAKRTILGQKVTAPFVIDGDITKPVWKNAPTVTAFTDFITGKLVDDQTTVYVLYDEKFIYLGFDCIDTHPTEITARETVRDSKFLNSGNGPTNTEDNIEVVLDPYSTHSYADLSRFSVNPLGTKSAQLAGGRGSKAEWKGDWDAAVKRTATGWTCEMRIPWASINYPSASGPLNIGINFTRFITRTRALQEWSATGPQGFLEGEGNWLQVEVPRHSFRRTLSLLPYVLGGSSSNKLGFKTGLDARYTITPQLTAVGTINPDYSNIEGSVESIAFSHSPHTVAETRPFFTEGGQNFNDFTNINQLGNLFYSPAIDRFDAGAKVYGKLTPNDAIGALDTIQLGERNDLVARYTHNINATTTAGALLVDATTPQQSSTLAAVDGHTRIGKLAGESIVLGTAGDNAGGGAGIYTVDYQDKRLLSAIQYFNVSNNVSNPDSFFPFTGYKGLAALEDLSDNWRHGYIRSSEFGIYSLDYRQMDDSPFYKGASAFYNFTTRNDLALFTDYNRFDFLGAADNYFDLGLTQGATNRFRQFGVQFSGGIQGGVPTSSFGPNFSLRVLKKLDLGYTGFIQNRQGVTQQHILTANYELSPTKSVGGRIISQNGQSNLYVFFHNSGGKGTDFYVLYGDPNALKTVNRLQVKAVFSF